MRSWIVVDPVGLEHRILHDGEQLWGFENVAHCFEPGDRSHWTGSLLRAILAGGLTPPGYTWREESS